MQGMSTAYSRSDAFWQVDDASANPTYLLSADHIAIVRIYNEMEQVGIMHTGRLPQKIAFVRIYLYSCSL